MGKDEKPVQAQLPKSGIEDGIYLVHADGKATLFELEYTKDDPMDSEVEVIKHILSFLPDHLKK